MKHYTEFEKAVKHVKDCLFWDFVDGVWNDVIVTPLDRNYFNRLMQQVSDAHAREVETLNAENAKLRKLVRDFLYEHEDYFAEGNYFIGDIDLEHAMQHNHAVFRHEARELGVEVD